MAQLPLLRAQLLAIPLQRALVEIQCELETEMKYLHINDRAKCMHISSTDPGNGQGFEFRIWLVLVCNLFARIVNSGLDYKTNGLHWHAGL